MNHSGVQWSGCSLEPSCVSCMMDCAVPCVGRKRWGSVVKASCDWSDACLNRSCLRVLQLLANSSVRERWRARYSLAPLDSVSFDKLSGCAHAGQFTDAQAERWWEHYIAVKLDLVQNVLQDDVAGDADACDATSSPSSAPGASPTRCGRTAQF